MEIGRPRPDGIDQTSADQASSEQANADGQVTDTDQNRRALDLGLPQPGDKPGSILDRLAKSNPLGLRGVVKRVRARLPGGKPMTLEQAGIKQIDQWHTGQPLSYPRNALLPESRLRELVSDPNRMSVKPTQPNAGPTEAPVVPVDSDLPPAET